MDIIKDFFRVSKSSFLRSLKAFRDNWYISFIGLVYNLILALSFIIVSKLLIGPFSILSGFIVSILMTAIISNYLYSIKLIVAGDRVGLGDFKDGFTVYIWKVYGVFFTFWAISFLLGLVANGLRFNNFNFSMILRISFFVLFNPLPEVVYQKDYIPRDSLVYSLNFMKKNWIYWGLSNIILSAIFYLGFNDLYINIRSTHYS